MSKRLMGSERAKENAALMAFDTYRNKAMWNCSLANSRVRGQSHEPWYIRREAVNTPPDEPLPDKCRPGAMLDRLDPEQREALGSLTSDMLQRNMPIDWYYSIRPPDNLF